MIRTGREAQNILLLLVGGALLKITLNGTYLRYVKPAVEPWVLTAGVVMVALAVIAIIADIRAARPPAVHTDPHGHSHAARSPWLLVLPVLAIFLIAPPALGADSVLRSDGRGAVPAPVVQQGPSAFPPLPTTAVVPLALSEFITRSVWDGTHSLTGRTVALTGFIVQVHGSTYVARLVITCCAADATPMKVELAGGQASALPDDQWIVADGILVPGSATAANEYTPTLRLRAITQIAQPSDPYEY
ncbi:MAG TPA: TIGR03943 family protein [Pseudonocardiaceae bacterium]|nr:TIGR03943 family protein [Pseudonocardiaceae bacterium]